MTSELLASADFVPLVDHYLLRAPTASCVNFCPILGIYVCRERLDWVAVLCDCGFIVECLEVNRPHEYALRLPSGGVVMRGITYAGIGGWAFHEWLEKAEVTDLSAWEAAFWTEKVLPNSWYKDDDYYDEFVKPQLSAMREQQGYR